MKKLLISSLALGALSLTAGQAKAASIVIDDFNDGPTFNTLAGTAPPEKVFTDTIAAPGIVGGERTVTHTLETAATSFNTSTLFVNGDADVFALDNGSGVVAEAGSSYGPGLSIPTDPGSFVFQIPFYDAPESDPAQLTLTVNGVSFTEVIPLGETEFSIPISAFGSPATINELSFVISGPAGFDIQIDQFDYVVPEPMTIFGTGLALAALPGLKKAHSKKKAQ